MLALLRVEWLRLKRMLWVFLLSVGMPVVFFLIFSSTVQMDSEALQLRFVKSYMLTMTGFSMSGFGLFTFPFMLMEDRKNHWLIYVEHSPLPIWQYYLAKVVIIYACYVVSLVMVFMVGAGVRGITMTGGEWLISALLLLLSSLVFLAFGLILSQAKSEQAVSVISNLVYFVLAILGGSWMPISLFPRWLQTICHLTPTYHLNHLVTGYALDGLFDSKSLMIVLAYAIIGASIGLWLKRQSEVG